MLIALLALTCLLLAVLDWLLFWAWLEQQRRCRRLLELELERQHRNAVHALHVVNDIRPPAA